CITENRCMKVVVVGIGGCVKDTHLDAIDDHRWFRGQNEILDHLPYNDCARPLKAHGERSYLLFRQLLNLLIELVRGKAPLNLRIACEDYRRNACIGVTPEVLDTRHLTFWPRQNFWEVVVDMIE